VSATVTNVTTIIVAQGLKRDPQEIGGSMTLTKHHLLRCAVLWLTVISLTTLVRSNPALSSVIATPIYECEGNACSVTTLSWDQGRQQFKVENSSAQEVKVTVNTFAGSSSVIVLPHKENYLDVKTFNGPYNANYNN